MQPFTTQALSRLEQNRILTSIQQGMLLSLPITITASFALLCTSIPIDSFQHWLRALFGGAVFSALSLLHSATSGIISLVFLLAISRCYEQTQNFRVPGLYPLTAMCAYIAFLSDTERGFSFSRFSSQWVFYAIVIAILSSILVEKLWLLQKKRKASFRGDGSLFYTLIPVLLPIGLTVLCFAFCNILLGTFLHNTNFQEILSSVILSIFDGLGRTLPSGLLFMVLLHACWFLGIHGGIILDVVARQFFIPGTEINAALISSGRLPTEILSKTFFDTFVLMGGCGSALCLVIAILLFDSRKSKRALAKLSFFPVLFNINELIIFGIPLVLNPLYLIPFLLSPLVLTLSSYTALLLGLVPYTTQTVEWTTPIFLSAYIATGSFAGVVLQVCNLALGVAIYLPFVRLSQQHQKMTTQQQIDQLVHLVQEGEAVGKLPKLLDITSPQHTMANLLAEDLACAIQSKTLLIYYQPQLDAASRLVGAEALLRWEYFPGTFLYPPLLIALAEEKGLQQDLGNYIMQTVCEDMQTWREAHQLEVPISLNVTASMLEDTTLPERLLALRQKHQIPLGFLGVEITEQTALSLSADVESCLDALRNAGAKIFLDDFGMGHSSMMYLQNNHFDVVKLDGSLIRQMLGNPRSQDIIASIVYLSRSLLFDVCAEFVETEEQAETLRRLGCQKFQGYLYSPPLEPDKFLTFANSLNAAHQTIQQRFPSPVD